MEWFANLHPLVRLPMSRVAIVYQCYCFPSIFWTLATIVLIGGCNEQTSPHTSTSQQDFQAICSQATVAMKTGQLQLASRYASAALQLQPNDPQALEVAGEIEGICGNHQAASEFISLAVKHTQNPPVSLLDKLGRSYMNCGRPFEALATLKSAVRLHPNNRTIRADLAGLLAALGCEFEAKPHLQWLVKRGYGSLSELSILSDLTRSQTDEEMCNFALRLNENDLRPIFPLSRDKVFHRNWVGLSTDLRSVVARHPEFAVAQAYYGRALSEIQDQSSINTWLSTLPVTTMSEPQYWMALGVHAEHNNQTKAAARAYWQSCRINIDDPECLSHLAHALSKAGMPQEAKACAARAGQISRLRDQVDALYERHNQSQLTAVKIAKTLESLGRLWEAAAWLQIGSTMPHDKDPCLAKVYTTIRQQITPETPWQLSELDVVQQLDLNDWPLAEWHSQKSKDDHPSSTASSPNVEIAFVDTAESCGLIHTCSIKPPENERSGVWVYQTAAGGAAAIDFDLDGWPDVCLSTMDGTPLESNSSPDRLFRNLRGQFADVTHQAEMGDRGFTQGISVGDINMDGFDDLYIANIGPNSIYLNCGDGTFRKAHEEIAHEKADWTSSVALVDLNQDGLVDLFEVGYCDIRETLRQPCVEEGKANPCRPSMFTALSDRVWQGTRDGHFIERSREWLNGHDPGRGFGIVTGFFDDQPGIDVYVANDMTANNFWSTSPSSNNEFQLSDQAYVRGVAVDRSSRSQASMGIAAGDPDQDGDIDFYATHYQGEYNTYYEQDSPGIWADISESNGHSKATMDLLGFGTQFIDADNDGCLELIVANGHVMKQEGGGLADRMPSQLMTQTSSGGWRVQAPLKKDSFFANKRISRCLINLDYNRDGKTDCLMTHIGSPISLLSNQTETQNRSLTIFLKGTQCHPDAIGSVVSMQVSGKTTTQQLIGGNGFQCSNQRCLTFAIGETKTVKSTTVTWPSGTTEHFGTIPENGEWLLVEGSGEATHLSP